LTGLQGGIKGLPGNVDLHIADANTAVSLAKAVTSLQLPAAPSNTNGVSAAWSSSKDTVISNAGAVTHGNSAEEVTLSLVFTKGSATKTVAVAKFTVEAQGQQNTDQADVNAEAAKIKDATLTGLQGGIKGLPGNVDLHIADANTAVSLAKAVTSLQLPAAPSNTNGVSAAWSSSKDTVISNAGAVTHGNSAEEVTLSLVFTKGSATKTVALAKFTVEAK
ncbi:MAG: immunoglobulin-like domain-containing protein, partial [Treponema sp.]